MMKYFLIFLVVISAAVLAYGDDVHKLRGKHLENGLACADCHGTDSPSEKAPQSACRGCHGDMTDMAPLAFKDTSGHDFKVNPHNSHLGSMRCTKCHQIHSPSKLFCNEGCHHSFELNVP